MQVEEFIMRFPSRFKLKVFPNDNRLWKIDWFGDLLPNPNARSEPLIELFIVPFKGIKTSNEILKRKDSYDHEQTRKINVGLSLLPFLHLGTFWKNGFQHRAIFNERLNFKNLQISEETTCIINAEDFASVDKWKIYFPSIENCLQTNFLQIDYPESDKGKLLIPCYEIIRFYFAGSSHLTRRIFTGGIRANPNALFDESQTSIDETTGNARIILRPQLLGTDRYAVARLAFSKTANDSAWDIYSGVVKNIAHNNRRIVEATFPFVGGTNLQTHGKWFKKDDVWHFLVHFIGKCSYPLPWRQLAWGIEGERETTAAPTTEERQTSIVRYNDRDRDVREVVSDDEPSLKTLFDAAFYDGRRFSDLSNKPPETRLKAENTNAGTTKYVVVTVPTDETCALSTAEGTFGDSQTRGLSVSISEDAEIQKQNEDEPRIIPVGWYLFTNILAGLESDGIIKTRILSFQVDNDRHSETGQLRGIYFPSVINGKTTAWAFLDKERKHRRQAMLAEIAIGEKFYYLFDTEVRLQDENDRYSILLIKDKANRILDERFWKMIFVECVKSKGRKRDYWLWNETRRFHIRHDLNEASKYVAKIKDFLIQF